MSAERHAFVGAESLSHLVCDLRIYVDRHGFHAVIAEPCEAMPPVGEADFLVFQADERDLDGFALLKPNAELFVSVGDRWSRTAGADVL